MIVSIMAQGQMGAATGARLAASGIEVRTLLSGRSPASARRAADAGMKAVDEVAFVAADFILSIVPPAAAIPLARSLAPFLMATPAKPIYVDLNAISPDSTMMVEMILAPSRCGFVDGGIIGGPPGVKGYSPTYCVSGPEAAKVAALEQFGLRIGVLDGPVGAASALKMSYAGITKGLTGLAASMILAAERAGVSEALRAELGASQPTLLAGFNRSIPGMFSKAGRWVAEMEEIGAFAGRDGRAEGDLYRALAGLYARLAKDLDDGQEEIDKLRKFVEPNRQ